MRIRVIPVIEVLVLFNTTTNAVICLAQSESATTEKEACVGELVRIQDPDTAVGEWLDAIANAVICLDQGGPTTTGWEACTSELIRVRVNPEINPSEWFDALANAVICLAHFDRSGMQADLANQKANGAMSENNSTGKITTYIK